MSVHVMSWVLRHSEEAMGRRLVLLVIADHANHDGTKSWCSVATIAHEARLSRSQVQRCLRGLEGSGAISETGKGPKGTHEYSVVMVGPQIAAGGAASASELGAASDDLEGRILQPKPSLEQPSNQEPSRPSAVDRKPVSADEWSLAQAILEVWNVLTHQQLRSHDWLRKIILRIREYPELTVSEHEHIIRYALDHPWWKGDPGPAVVYGNGSLFEQHLTQAAKGGAGVGAQGAFAVALAALKERRQA